MPFVVDEHPVRALGSCAAYPSLGVTVCARCPRRGLDCLPALDAGADPKAVAEWTRQVQAERAAVLARDASRDRPKPVRQFTDDDIRALTTGLGSLRDVIHDAEPAVKAAIYEQLGLKVTYLPGQDKLRADVTISPETFAPKSEQYGEMGRVRGPSTPKGQCVIANKFGSTWMAVDRDQRVAGAKLPRTAGMVARGRVQDRRLRAAQTFQTGASSAADGSATAAVFGTRRPASSATAKMASALRPCSTPMMAAE